MDFRATIGTGEMRRLNLLDSVFILIVSWEDQILCDLEYSFTKLCICYLGAFWNGKNDQLEIFWFNWADV